MIPKVIHYCWFGKKKKPRLIRKCIRSWKKYCPDYEIVEWNESNFDLASAPLFVRQAVERQKWAFATDYIRLKVLYEHGGIYLDTDIELLKNLNLVLDNRVYFGFEYTDRVSSGLGFGAEQHAQILMEIMAVYESASFLQDDGTPDETWNSIRETMVLQRHGLRLDGSEQMLPDGIHIYPKTVFCPFDLTASGSCFSKDTISIHWYAASWWDKAAIRRIVGLKRYGRLIRIVKLPNRLGLRILGRERYEQIKKRLKKR